MDKSFIKLEQSIIDLKVLKLGESLAKRSFLSKESFFRIRETRRTVLRLSRRSLRGLIFIKIYLNTL